MDFTFIGWIAATLTSTAFIPQIIKGLKSKKLYDVSTFMLVVSASGVFLWMLYGFVRKDLIIICANLFTLCTIVSLIIMKFFYRNKGD